MANLNKAYNLDAPLWSQYLTYLGNLLRGDLGPSFTRRDFSVNDLFAVGMPVSILLGGLALIVAVILGTLLRGLGGDPAELGRRLRGGRARHLRHHHARTSWWRRCSASSSG